MSGNDLAVIWETSLEAVVEPGLTVTVTVLVGVTRAVDVLVETLVV